MPSEGSGQAHVDGADQRYLFRADDCSHWRPTLAAGGASTSPDHWEVTTLLYDATSLRHKISGNVCAPGALSLLRDIGRARDSTPPFNPGRSVPIVSHDGRPWTRRLVIKSSAFHVGRHGVRGPRTRSIPASMSGRIRLAFQLFGLESVDCVS